jgi:SAM-dependent methyltransferase
MATEKTASSSFKASDGSVYERLMGRWSRRLAEPFLDFAGVGEDEQVLDLGCGTGSLSAALAKRTTTGRITGVDFSEIYVEFAKARNDDPRIEFQVGDACALAFDDAQFDRVLSLLMLQFVPEAERAVAEMRRVARPGAVVAATVWDARGGYVANRMFFDTAVALNPAANERRARNFTRPMMRPGELAAAWQAAGLENVADTALTIRMAFASFEDFWAPLTGQDGTAAQYMAKLDDTQREALAAAMRAAYLDGDPDGPRSYAATAWAVRGTVPV